MIDNYHVPRRVMLHRHHHHYHHRMRLSKPVPKPTPTLQPQISPPTVPASGGSSETGGATWYDPPWSGYTAAHKTLPFGTHVTVTNLDTGHSIVVVIDDRGPYGEGRIIDLSPEAFSALAPLSQGVLNVRISW